MRITFRTDASIEIGTGHVMRCLTLANELKRQGHHCRFICRQLDGNLNHIINAQGFELCPLSHDPESVASPSALDCNPHATWLGADWQQDAVVTQALLKQHKTDWLVVDHYALDARWEKQVSNPGTKVMVIDDLADRSHQCELLLDQTYGRSPEEYRNKVLESCTLLCGARYALLRPEFSQLRSASLRRRTHPRLRQLLINLGGVDKDNVTGQVLDALRSCTLPDDCRILVIMGGTAPWLETVKQQAQTMPWNTEVRVGVSNMAELMAQSDLAIGAAGSTSWERCCLGLPTIMLTLAENQKRIAKALEQTGAAVIAMAGDKLSENIKQHICVFQANPQLLTNATKSSAAILDGTGTQTVVQHMKL